MKSFFFPAVLSLGISQASTIFSPETFEFCNASIEDVHNALYTGLASCRDIVSSFLSRIEAFNPTINAIISLNPNALAIADYLDAKVASGNTTGTLFCIPVLLKDSYDTNEMNTTGGCQALARHKPLTDAPVVKALKDAGAIILGKTNLHELALEGLAISSLGGQTINPYDHTRTPGGSSGGTGAAIAAGLALFGTGTDTVNSLKSPASANSLFSVRPTRGLISRAGIIPVSYTQDTIGPIARNARDLAVALTVMASAEYDPRDNATTLIPETAIGVDFSKAVYGASLRGLRLGLLEGFLNRTSSYETTPVNTVMDKMIAGLQAAGATVVVVNENLYNATALMRLDVQTSEFRESMNSYLKTSIHNGSHPATLAELYGSKEFMVIPGQYSYINTALASSTSNSSYLQKKVGIQSLATALALTFNTNNLAALIYPEQKNLVVKIGSPSQSGRNGILAALTGFPVVTVPAGFSLPSEDAPIRVPIGMEILGLPWTEGKLLNIAAHISDNMDIRQMPAFANASVEMKTYLTVPSVVSRAIDISGAYPVGVLYVLWPMG